MYFSLYIRHRVKKKKLQILSQNFYSNDKKNSTLPTIYKQIYK